MKISAIVQRLALRPANGNETAANLSADRARSRARAGFSLVELLATMAVMLLVGTVVVTGIPAAQKAYVNAVDASNAQALLSMSAERLRGELSVANTGVEPVESTGNLITFQSDETGYKTTIKNGDDGLHLVESAFNGDLSMQASGEYALDELLVPASATKVTDATRQSDRLVSKADRIIYNPTNKTFTIENLRIEREGAVVADAQIDRLEVRVL